MQSCAARIGLVVLVAILIAGCGGGGNTNVITPAKNTTAVVGQVTLTPASLSIVAGQVPVELHTHCLSTLAPQV